MSQFKILLLLALTWNALASASVVVPNDVNYYRWRSGDTLYVYDEKSREFIDQLAAYNQALHLIYEKSFRWKLDERQDLILLSPRQQIANGYATVIPNLKTVWYPSGAGMLEEFAQSSWLMTLAIHETAHLYQLNAKAPFNAGLKKIFGNAFVVAPFWPIFIHPNILTPTFLVEGNAVMNESRVNMGGRLHAGEKRALVLAQIKENQIDPNRLVNDQFLFPYGETPYLQGGYFQAHLAAKYGVEKTNSFFVKQGEHYLWPFILNKTFRDHFGSSYPQEIREYVHNMAGLAKNQKFTVAQPTIETVYAGPLNHDEKRIWFLTTKGVAPPILHVFEKASGDWTQKSTDMLMGKVFWQDGKPYSSASFQNNLHNVEYSLYGEDLVLDPKYLGQIVNDMRAGKVVSLDGGNSWLEPRILLNGERFDVAHSNPVLDEQGNVYYFRQNGAERMLFKNRELVFKFEGFYGKVMEVAADGTVYFIANTDYGSTLYRYRKNEISRMLASDRVVEARSIAEDRFLAVEIAGRGHEFHLLKAQVSAAQPAHYSYGFSSENLAPQTPAASEQVAKEEYSYNSLRELRFSALEFASGYSSYDGLTIATVGTFTDPLQYQAFALGYGGSTSKPNPQQALVSYAFTKYLTDFQILYLYNEDDWLSRAGQEQLEYNQKVAAGIRLPFLRWRRWDAELSINAVYEKRDIPNDIAFVLRRPNIEETYGVESAIGFRYQLAPPLGLLSWREFSIDYRNRLESLPNAWEKKYNTSMVQTKYQHGLPKDFYVTALGVFAWAENQDISVEYNPLGLAPKIGLPLLTGDRTYEVKTGGVARLEIEKSIDFPAYSTRVPIGISRFAPLVLAQGIFFDDDHLDRYPANDFEYGYGADVELLLLHKARVPIRLISGVSTRYPYKEDTSITLKYKAEF